MPDLYRAFAEDWSVKNATFEELLTTAECQEFGLLIFSLQTGQETR